VYDGPRDRLGGIALTKRTPNRFTIRTRSLALVGTLALCGLWLTPTLADDKSSAEYPNPQLARLDDLVGTWKVTEQHFNERGDEVASASGTEEIMWILDRHALKRSYQTSTTKTSYSAIGTFTWNDAEGRYRGVWFDNFSTSGPTVVNGKWDDNESAFVFVLEAKSRDGTALRHKVVERFEDERTRVATTYALNGDKAVKRLEVRYARTSPCPARTFMFGGPGVE
jgi:hypothetical protein